MHACCGHTHTAIDVALDLREDIDLGAVRSIRIETYGPGYAIVKEPNPNTPYRAQFSIAYVVAAALAEGRVGLDQFSAARFDSDGVREQVIASLLERTSVHVSDDLTAKYPAAWPARLSIELTDGRRVEGAADFPRGNPRPRALLKFR